MLKSLLPRTLFGRTLVILITPLVLAQIVATYVFYERHWDDVTRRLALGLAGDISMVIQMLREAPAPDQQARVLALAEENFNMAVTWRPDDILPNARLSFQLRNLILDRVLAQAIEERLFRPYRIDTVSYANKVEVRVQLQGGVLRVLTPRKRLSSTTTIIFVMWMVGSSLVLLAIAVAFLRNQMRPIRRLAEAADSFGKGRAAADIKPSGASEVRQAARAFLRMRERIQRQISQRTEMLAGVSHDLRTPLTRMKLQLAMLDDSAEIGNLRRDVAAMEDMVGGYLDFARGQESEAAVPTDLRPILNEIVEQANRQGSTVELTAGGEMMGVVRPNAFKRCITNLVDNAQRHGRCVSIAAAKSNGFIEIAVDDDGPGIPSAARDEVFRPFHRLDGSRNPETGGVGLGLTIARDVARSHGGDVTLGDAPSGGLRALVHLPA